MCLWLLTEASQYPVLPSTTTPVEARRTSVGSAAAAVPPHNLPGAMARYLKRLFLVRAAARWPARRAVSTAAGIREGPKGSKARCPVGRSMTDPLCAKQASYLHRNPERLLTALLPLLVVLAPFSGKHVGNGQS
jgi:hypothetical protein